MGPAGGLGVSSWVSGGLCRLSHRPPEAPPCPQRGTNCPSASVRFQSPSCPTGTPPLVPSLLGAQCARAPTIYPRRTSGTLCGPGRRLQEEKQASKGPRVVRGSGGLTLKAGFPPPRSCPAPAHALCAPRAPQTLILHTLTPPFAASHTHRHARTLSRCCSHTHIYCFTNVTPLRNSLAPKNKNKKQGCAPFQRCQGNANPPEPFQKRPGPVHSRPIPPVRLEGPQLRGSRVCLGARGGLPGSPGLGAPSKQTAAPEMKLGYRARFQLWLWWGPGRGRAQGRGQKGGRCAPHPRRALGRLPQLIGDLGAGKVGNYRGIPDNTRPRKGRGQDPSVPRHREGPRFACSSAKEEKSLLIASFGEPARVVCHPNYRFSIN